MNVPLRIQIGLGGTQKLLNPIQLDAGSVGASSSWAGSYHVLAMGRHYDDYVITGRQLSLAPIPGFPPAHPYERLAGKIRASGVTGNVGEAVAALFACRYLSAAVADIAHIRPRRPFRRRKAPDYLMRIGSSMPGVFNQILPSGMAFTWPEWWPVESKARSTRSSADAGRREALGQLAVYWSLLAGTQPAVVGFGLIVVLRYRPPREVRVSVMVPRDQSRLIGEFQQKGQDVEPRILRNCLHGC